MSQQPARSLAPANPLDHVRLLARALGQPASLPRDPTLPAYKPTVRTGAALLSTLTFLPLLLPVAALLLDTVPEPETVALGFVPVAGLWVVAAWYVQARWTMTEISYRGSDGPAKALASAVSLSGILIGVEVYMSVALNGPFLVKVAMPLALFGAMTVTVAVAAAITGIPPTRERGDDPLAEAPGFVQIMATIMLALLGGIRYGEALTEATSDGWAVVIFFALLAVAVVATQVLFRLDYAASRALVDRGGGRRLALGLGAAYLVLVAGCLT